MSKYYCCTQSNHGHDYRYVFTESQIWEGFGYVPKKFDYEDIHWPIGGSNSSATLVNKIVDTVEDVFAWLWSPCDGPDADDPMMIDYAEYCMSVATDEGVAGKILKRYNLNPEDMEQDAPDFEEVKTMFEKVFGIPFNEGAYHQEFRDIRRSALEELFIQKFSSLLITFENTHRDSEPENGIVDCICIDGYPAEGEGEVVAKVIKTFSNDIVVVYQNNAYRVNEEVNALIEEARDMLLKEIRCTVYATDIEWDTDGEKVGLPEEVLVDNVELDESIADALSDIYGYCVKSFRVEVRNL